MASFKLKMDSDVNSKIAHLPEVKDQIQDKAERMAARARSKLLQHRHDGVARITVDYGTVDALVSLVSDGVFAIEYGHEDREGGEVAGLRILRDSLAELRE